MSDDLLRSATDPQHDPDAAPRVGSTPSLWPLVLGTLGALGLGTIVFLQLANNRTQMEQARLAASRPAPAPVVIAAPQPAPLPVQPVIEPIPLPPPPVIEQPQPPPQPVGPTQAEIDHLRAPALVIDLGDYKAPVGVTATGSPLDPKAISGAVGSTTLNPSERFAQRLGVGDASRPAHATSRIDLANTVVEGAILPAVLETALNSDLPGYVRAVISRDVRSFDGSQVLIPHGSRLIGQYQSGIALGQSRAFVIWTRLIRPDGATIDLSSPATDALGRGGVNGKVDRHFLQRFGGAMLLTLLNLGVNAATEASDTAIVVASTRSGGDAASVALGKNQDISPTVTVPPGAPVRVFVSQDLDFSAVGPANAPKRTPVVPDKPATPAAASATVPAPAPAPGPAPSLQAAPAPTPATGKPN